MTDIVLINSEKEQLNLRLEDFMTDKEVDIIKFPEKYNKLDYDITMEELLYRLHNRFDGNFLIDNNYCLKGL